MWWRHTDHNAFAFCFLRTTPYIVYLTFLHVARALDKPVLWNITKLYVCVCVYVCLGQKDAPGATRLIYLWEKTSNLWITKPVDTLMLLGPCTIRQSWIQPTRSPMHSCNCDRSSWMLDCVAGLVRLIRNSSSLFSNTFPPRLLGPFRGLWPLIYALAS